MKTKPIQTVDQLHGEIARLSSLAKDQEQRIKEDVKQIREELRPENLAVSALSAITGIRLNRNEFLKKGFTVGIGLLLQRFVFKTESKLEQKVYHWLDFAFDRLKNLVNRYTKTGQPRTDSIVDEDSDQSS